ncbi:MAG: hypothetical protein V7765_17255 [Oleispira sp.]
MINININKSEMSKKMTMRLTLLGSAAMLAALIFTSQASLAEENEQQTSQRRGPPPAAFTACEGKSAGEKAQFETRRGTILAGTCEEIGGKNAGKLVLRPDDRSNKKSKNRTPPAEAFSACEGKKQGDLSQFENHRGKILKGSCEDMNGKLVLRPERFK